MLLGDPLMNEDYIKQMQKTYAIQLQHIVKMVQPRLIAMEEARKRIAPVIQRLATQYDAWFDTNSSTISIIAQRQEEAINLYKQLLKWQEQSKIWQKKFKQDVVVMAENGWFPNWFTFEYQPEVEVNDIDMLMAMQLNDNWPELTNYLIELYPNRKHILEAAFALHKEGNYVASIPLFISQADGIFCEEVKTFLFTDSDKPLFKEKDTEVFFDTLMQDGKLQKGLYEDILLEPLKVKTQFKAGVRESTPKHKAKAPNRNGIMHGHRKHLDYGTELNSLKSLSLLAFVVCAAKEVFKDTSS